MNQEYGPHNRENESCMHFLSLITGQLPTFKLFDYAMQLYEVFHVHETFLVL